MERMNISLVILITFVATTLFLITLMFIVVNIYGIDITINPKEPVVDKEVIYPEKCDLLPDFYCLDFSGNDAGVTLIIQNNASFEIRDLKVTINFLDGDISCVDWSGDSTLVADEIDTFTCSGPLYYGQHIGKVKIDYVNAETTLANSKSGNIIVNV